MAETTFLMSDEQLRTAREAVRANDHIDEMLGRAIVVAAERRAENESEFWRAMHEMCKTSERTHVLRINWMTGVVAISPRTE